MLQNNGCSPMGDQRGLGKKETSPKRMELSPQQISEANCFFCSFCLAEHPEADALSTL